jgi:hypothetical protein
LGSVFFEEIVITKSAWGPDLYNMAAWNESQVEEVDSFDFEELLLNDTEAWPGTKTWKVMMWKVTRWMVIMAVYFS